MDLERRERPQPLQHGVVLETGERPGGHFPLQELLLVERQALPRLPLRLGGLLDRLVELGHLDLAVLVLELAQDADQRLQRVGRDAAVRSRVQVAVQRPDGDLGVADPPERRVHRGDARRIKRRIADERRIGVGALGLDAEQVAQHLPAALLLALDDEVDVERRHAVGIARGLVGLEQAVDLALVVGGAAAVEAPLAHGGVERRRLPLLERIGRLDVIVPVDEQRGLPRHPRALRPHDGMSFSLDEVHHGAAQAAELVHQPHGGAPAVGRMGRERTHARDRKELGQLGEHAGLLAAHE